LLHDLAGHLENHQATGGMPGKMVGAGRLNRAHLLDIVGCKYSQIRLMFVDKCGELETVHRLLRAQSVGQFHKAQETSSESMSDK